MEEEKYSKGSQENNRRFVRNTKEDNSFNQSVKENNTSSQGGKVNSVNPRYSSAERAKHVEMKPGMVVINTKQNQDGNRNENKGNFKGKDGHFRGQHTQRDHRSNFKHDDRRKFSFPKEKTNRYYKSSGRNQSKGNEKSSVASNEETIPRKQPYKNDSGSVVLKRSENINTAGIHSTTQYFKPAVHVQPLQQVPEKTGPGVRSAVEQNKSSLQTADSNLRSSSKGNTAAEECLEVSSVSYAKETNTQRSTSSRQGLSPQASSTMVPSVPGEVEAPTDLKDCNYDFQKHDLDKNPLNPVNPLFQSSSETRTLADLNNGNSGLGGYLSSSICSSFVPAAQNDLLKPHSNPSTNHNMPLDNSLMSTQLALAQGQPINHSKNFITEQHVPSTNKSQDLRSSVVHDNVKEPLIGHSQNSEGYQVPRNQLEEAVCLQNMPDEKYGYRISVDSLFSTSFFTNPQAGVKNKEEVVDTDRSDSVDHDVVKNKKCKETLVFSGQVPQDHLLYEAKQFDMIKNNNPSLFAYQSLPHFEDTYKRDENLDSHLVSPRRSNIIDKPALGNPPPALRNHAPRVSLESQCAATLIKDAAFAPESTNTRTYTNFSDSAEKGIGKEIFPSENLSGFSRKDNSTGNIASEKEMVVRHLNSAHTLQEPMAKLTLTKNNSDEQTDSLVNLNYREIPKHSMSVQTDGFTSEAKKAVSIHCPTTTDKTSHLNKAELQPTGTSPEKEVFEKQKGRPLDVENNRVHRGPFPQAQFLPNPFLGHSLLTHRQAIPSAFVYPSRVGMPGGHSAFTDVAQHTGTNPGTHIFPPHGSTVYLNVGGRIFEILPSTFSPYPESLLCQIFSGATPTPINQRGHIFFDRDGYLFEIILAFARVGHLALPANVNLTSLMNEAKFFGMYEYMFQKGQVSSENMLQFQRTTRCTLHCNDSSKSSDTRVFVLQGDDKLKIESLRVSGPCYLYVDLYTPLGVKETSKFVIYTPDKPDLWKAYQFCAERQLVFYLERPHSDNTVTSSNKASADIVFSQTFVFIDEEFLP